MQISLVSSPTPALISDLAEVLRDCVDGGASVGYVRVPSVEAASEYWAGVLAAPEILVWVASDEAGRVVGTVQLQLCTKENGLHRAEIAKLLVHRGARRRGLGRELMKAAEERAQQIGRALVVLDTETGSGAERLYKELGYVVAGTIDGYALSTAGKLRSTTLLTKILEE